MKNGIKHPLILITPPNLWNTLNHLPEITGINPISVYEGQASNFNIDVFDEDGDELEISWVMGDGTVFENVGKEVFHSFSDNGSLRIEFLFTCRVSFTRNTY